MVARTVPGVSKFYVPADELWAALGPRSYRIVQRWIEGTLHPAVWDPVLAVLLKLPAWMLLGVPGGLLAWFFRPPRGLPPDFDPEAPFLHDDWPGARRRKDAARRRADTRRSRRSHSRFGARRRRGCARPGGLP
jgi:hypothetical protein